MIQGRVIVCLGSAWDYDPTSKHHIMRVLSRHNTIIWIDYHGSRRPRLNTVDFRAGWSALRRMAQGIKEVAPNIMQLTPLVVPGASGSWGAKLHQRLLIQQIRSAVARVTNGKDRPTQIWSFAPDVPYLVGSLQEECFVYYCVDDYREFEGFDRRFIASAETELIKRASLVVTTSDALYQSRRQDRSDICLLRHGVDFDHFAQAWRDPPTRPTDLPMGYGGILGFFGLIHHWTDVSLLAAAAQCRPQYAFVLIGESKVDVSALRRQTNVTMLGRRPYETLPAYGAAFGAGLLPFTRCTMTRSINPIKMYEYLAAGLPVVSTSLPEAARFQGPIQFADTPESFAAACDQALSSASNGLRESIAALVSGEDWSAKVEQLSDWVMDSVAQRNGGSTGLRTATAGNGSRLERSSGWGITPQEVTIEEPRAKLQEGQRSEKLEAVNAN